MSIVDPTAQWSATEVTLNGSNLSIDQVCQIALGQADPVLSTSSETLQQIERSQSAVDDAVRLNKSVYGVTTGFGGMANVAIDPEDVIASQRNLLSFLASSAGEMISTRHVRAAMLLRANVLIQGKSGVRLEIIERLIEFLRAQATPQVRELGSIGASGDLVPLSTIARAITGHSRSCQVEMNGQLMDGLEALEELELAPIELQAKEGLALVNGTSFSSAIAANCLFESRYLLALSLVNHAMMMRALKVKQDPFHPFVHENKPHAGQIWIAQMMRRMIDSTSLEEDQHSTLVQDCYSLRCLPQYLGPIVEGIARISQVVTTEMNSVTDNPLIDSADGQFYQSGNFLGQYVAISMDDLRRFIGLLAKHLDIQIAQLVTPAFNLGLPASLRGNSNVPYNMGLKGLQITGNSIMPHLTYFGNPVTEHFPSHAEQFNQNINGLSWTSANLAWRSVNLFKQYLSVSSLFAVQAVDLRAYEETGQYDGRLIIHESIEPVYSAIYESLDCEPGGTQPFLYNDQDRWLEKDLDSLSGSLESGQGLYGVLQPIVNSFKAEFESD